MGLGLLKHRETTASRAISKIRVIVRYSLKKGLEKMDDRVSQYLVYSSGFKKNALSFLAVSVAMTITRVSVIIMGIHEDVVVWNGFGDSARKYVNTTIKPEI